ncbi:MAG: selenocysteine-specific translation elongation factor [Candidatus Delongbacteria bacterium]|nr:selenocysteine-specific translation elongation factor [Candidatus Delongbacteria bacterium]MBN2835353.1 selenocysteine-specific translation elongation factor [Candidatus Delongbacteria bacterium]
MDHFIIGTAGHIDHGKTSLVKALTGMNTDTLKEEQERNITIDIGFAFLGDDITIIDVPGHEKFIKNMVSGVTSIDFVILVIAADDGVMPQTREHLDIISLLGVNDGVIAVTKIDMVEEDWLELVCEDIIDYVNGTVLEGKPLIQIDSLSGKGIDQLRLLINERKTNKQSRHDSGVFKLPVDRVFTSKGYGTVVTGTILSGKVKEGDILKLQPSDKDVRVKNLECHGKQETELKTGDRAAINLHGVSKEEISRGDILTSGGHMKPVFMFESNLRILESAKPLKNRERVRVHIGTNEVFGRVAILEDELISPGDSKIVQFRLEENISLSIGDRYVIRTYSPQNTIGGGTVLTTSKKKIKTTDEKVINILKEMDQSGIVKFIEKIIERNENEIIDKYKLSEILTYSVAETEYYLNNLIEDKSIVVHDLNSMSLVHTKYYNKYSELVKSFLATFHKGNSHKQGVTKTDIKNSVFQKLSQQFADLVIETLEKENSIKIRDKYISIYNFEPVYNNEQKNLMDKIYSYYDTNSYVCDEISKIFSLFCKTEKEFRDILSILIENGKLKKTDDIHYFSDRGFENLLDFLNNTTEKNGNVSIKDMTECFSSSRKHIIPILEFLDQAKITKREGDVRIFNKV